MTDSMFDLEALANEPLCAELEPWVDHDGFLGAFLKHPLVYGPVLLPGHMNRQLERKKVAVAEALKHGHWERYLYLHERPWRLTRLAELVTAKHLKHKEFCELLIDMWKDTEMPHQFGSLCERLFTKAGFVTDDTAGWAKLREQDAILIWRGGYPRGISWTTDRDRARWFAKRFQQPRHRLFSAEVSPTDVHAYIIGRNESEIVAPWKSVRILNKEKP